MMEKSEAGGGDGNSKGGCAVCGDPTKQCCSKCRKVYYCGRIHQVQDWPNHKDDCGVEDDVGKGGESSSKEPAAKGPFSISISPELGQYLECTKDLEPGELIVKEPPLVLGPKHLTEFQPICLHCYKVVNVRPFCCTECGWPMCSKSCATSSTHKPECQAFQANDIKINNLSTEDMKNMLFSLVTVLRCLHLQKNDPRKWNKFLELEACELQRKGTEEYNNVKDIVVESMKRFFTNTTWTEDLIQRICGIIQINAVEIRMPDHNIMGVYQIGSLQEHNCVPSTHRTFDSNFRLIIRASVPLKKGDHLSCVYSDVLWPTKLRRKYLHKSKYFWCTCDRCKDPTELKTFLGSVRCTKCSEGYVTPINGLKEDCQWECHCCRNRAEKDTVEEINAFFEEMIKDMDGDQSIGANELFLEKFGGFFHDNHYHMLDIKTTLCTLYSQLKDPDDKSLKRLEELCKEVLQVANKVTPGISRFRGIVTYQCAIAALDRIQIYIKKGKGKNLLMDRLEVAEKMLKEAEWILSFEPENQPEAKLHATAKNRLAEIKDIRLQIEDLLAPPKTKKATAAKAKPKPKPKANGEAAPEVQQ